MSRAKIDPMVWYQNFKVGVGILIDEERAKGYSIRSVMMSESCHKKCCEAVGYDLQDILGYVIEVFENENDQDEVLITGNAYN